MFSLMMPIVALSPRPSKSRMGRAARPLYDPGTAFLETAPGCGDDKPARQPEPGFDDRQGQVYRAPSQPFVGNDIKAGSPGFEKAPTRSLASLVANRL
jgi:hypothetical protein